MINFFAVAPHVNLVDLPGYGYARVPSEIRSRWEDLLGFYLLQRACLRGLIIIVDARHGLNPLDRRMLEWFASTGKPVHILLTKADKLGREQQLQRLKATHGELAGLPSAATVQLFSSVTTEGVEQARGVISRLLEG